MKPIQEYLHLNGNGIGENGQKLNLPTLVFSQIPKNPYRGTTDMPFHISVGGLVYNDQGEILVHNFINREYKGIFWKSLWILMSETPEPNESLLEALLRGCIEEFGIIGEVGHCLGSVVGKFFRDGDLIGQKTTLYFGVKCIEQNEEWRQADDGDDMESTTNLLWVEPQEIIPKMKSQGWYDSSLDESPIVENFFRF